jgi:hypothetical protein
MPFDEELRDRIRAAAPPASTADVFDRISTRKRSRARMRKVGTIATVVVVLTGTVAAFAIVDARRAAPPALDEPTPTPSGSVLGLPYPVCQVSTMPFGSSAGVGAAAVFTRGSAGCHEDIQDHTYVGVDLDGDGTIDATTGPIPDCFTRCEAFAAPDVNGDGVDEVMVSTEGADGYGVWAYAVTVAPATIAPITEDGEPFGFAWVNVATHAEAAHCETTDAGQAVFVLDHAEWDVPRASVIEESFVITGTSATTSGQDRSSVPIETAPVPADELCGAPVHGSAVGAMGGPPVSEGRDIGLQANVCETSSLRDLNLVADASPDTAFVGYLSGDDGRCPRNDPERQRWIVAVDVTGDGEADASTDAELVNCANVSCWPLGGADLDADGDDELVVTTGFSIQDQGYFSVDASGGVSISPIDVASPGHPAARVQPGKPLQTSAGGDAGFGSWIRCEGYPTAPVLVFTYGAGDTEGVNPTEWHEVKLQLQADGLFHVVDATDLSLPAGQDPGLIRSVAPACGLDFRTLS